MNRIATLLARMTLPEKPGQLTMTACGVEAGLWVIC
jgi:hypothetical protein